jgi:ethanolamine utilization protein EutA
MAIRPAIDLASEAIDSREIAEAIDRAVEGLGEKAREQPIALCYRWQGPASYGRIDAFCRGVIAGLIREAIRPVALVLVADSDIGGLIGIHLCEECDFEGDVVSIDGIAVGDLDFIDVGTLIESSGAVPVVVKSLIFSVAPIIHG